MSIVTNISSQKLANRKTNWLDPSGKDHDIVLTTKMQLMRNLKGKLFPVKANPHDFFEIRNALLSAIDNSNYSKSFSIYNIDNLNEISRYVLLERRIISSEMAHAKRKGMTAGVTSGEELSFMINEDDHFKVQSLVAGLATDRAWKRLNKFINHFSELTEFSYSPEFGWVTSSPKNLGTGLRVSFFCHLPALTITDRLDIIFNKIISNSISIEGIFGDSHPNHSNIFQISNQATLGLSEDEIKEKTLAVVKEVIKAERKAKNRLRLRNDIKARDIVTRSFYILKHAKLLGVMEFVSFISAFRLGIDIGWIKGIDIHSLNKILVKSLPGHLSAKYEKMPNLLLLDKERAEFVSESLRNVELA